MLTVRIRQPKCGLKTQFLYLLPYLYRHAHHQPTGRARVAAGFPGGAVRRPDGVPPHADVALRGPGEARAATAAGAAREYHAQEDEGGGEQMTPVFSFHWFNRLT